MGEIGQIETAVTLGRAQAVGDLQWPDRGYIRVGKPPVHEPVPEHIEAVRAVFAAAESGMTDHEVSESVGIPFHTARHILTNAIYVGRLQDGSGARVEPVIDQATWDRM